MIYFKNLSKLKKETYMFWNSYERQDIYVGELQMYFEYSPCMVGLVLFDHELQNVDVSDK